MRRLAWLALALLLLPAAAAAKSNRCPLPLDTCIVRFGEMRERPWLGVYIDVDSLGRRIVVSTAAGGPADKAGLRPGDVIERLNGVEPQVFFATRAGWKQGDTMQAVVLRNGREHSFPFLAQHISEELLARIVGEHMLEAHLAYMVTDDDHGHDYH
jgi:predicted metalloprotease with PDZ domain